MLRVRRGSERGHFDHGWLDTYHTFSFGDYHDPAHRGFRSLRVMNEDRVAPGQGFGMHGHRDMEILTYVLSGRLAHRDSLGNGEELKPGEFQRMTAGTGIRHSEFNPSDTEPVHLYQIWLLPERTGLTPSYEQRAFADSERHNRLRVVASRDGEGGSLTIHQDARVLLATLDAKCSVEHAIPAGRHAWLQVLRGRVTAGGESLAVGDALAAGDVGRIDVSAEEPSEVLLFDLA
jgi:hypothetical protein